MNEQPMNRRAMWLVVLVASSILLITMGVRQTTGLFVSPLNTATGLGLVSISLAMAMGQLLWGVGQAVCGVASDRWGPTPVLVVGGLTMAAGLAITPWMGSTFGLIVAVGVLTATGAGAGSHSVLIGSVARSVPVENRSLASGVVNAGGSFGQFLFAPLTERIIAVAGWMQAYWTLAVGALLTLPLAWLLRRYSASAAVQATPLPPATGATPSPAQQNAAPGGPGIAAAPLAEAPLSLREQVAMALRDRSYLMLHLGFFTCGFHIAFLVTHLPGEVALCGMPSSVSGISIAIIGLANVVGSLAVGALGARYRMKYLLFGMYLSRAVMVLLYMVSPKDPATFYIFAVGLGLTWLATVPPTAGLVGKLYGVRYMSTLFGLTMLSHQVGGFLGAWLGGIAVTQSGSYDLMWIADAVLATIAAAANLPIREAPVIRPMPARAVAGG